MSDDFTPPTMALTRFTTNVTGEGFTVRRPAPGDYDAKVTTNGVPDAVHVSLVGEMNTNGYDDGHGNKTELPIAYCKWCAQPLNSDDYSLIDGEDTCEPRNGQPHDPEAIPLSWANSARIDLDSERDRIQLSVSIGDPRGAFMLEVRRELVGDLCEANCSPMLVGEMTSDDFVYMVGHGDTAVRCPTCNGVGRTNAHYELRMSVPHPDDSALHMPLTDLNGRGYYKIG